MEAKFSPKVKEVISFSREEALRLGHDYIGTEHLLLGIIREGQGLAVKALKSMDVDIVLLRKSIEDAVTGKSSSNIFSISNISLTKQAEKALKIALLEAKLNKSDTIGTEHLILSILKNKDNIATQILDQFDVNYEMFKDELDYLKYDIKNELADDPSEEEDEENPFGDERRSAGKKGSMVKSKTPVLDNYSRDV